MSFVDVILVNVKVCGIGNEDENGAKMGRWMNVPLTRVI